MFTLTEKHYGFRAVKYRKIVKYCFYILIIMVCSVVLGFFSWKIPGDPMSHPREVENLTV